jgi:hypothetical protein
MPTNHAHDSKKPRPSAPRPSQPDDEPKVITRGRVSHVEHEVDQPEPMPVRKSGERDKVSRYTAD